VNKIHWRYQDYGLTKFVYIYRDPRDCALSGWEYIKHHYAPGVSLMEFLERYFAGHWELWPCGWREHTRYWFGRDIAKVRYEALCADRECVLRGLGMYFGLKLGEENVTHAVAQSCRPEKQPTASVDRWKREMPPEAVAWMDDYCGDVIYELPYGRGLVERARNE
jgi:hypothetical protein